MTEPRTQPRRTALAMLQVFQAHAPGERIGVSEFRLEVDASGGDHRYIRPAAKYLRDRGVVVCAEKRRHRSAWYTPNSLAELAAYGDRCVAEMYSEAVSLARSATPGTYDKFVTTAVLLGERLGIAPQAVVGECTPQDLSLTEDA